LEIYTDTLHEGASPAARKTPGSLWPGHFSNHETDVRKDHFVEDNGMVYAGKHLILDLWDATELDNLALMENTLRKCVKAAMATLLHIHLHHFSPNGGISGVAVLAESHISVHTWPERDFAAFDIFMCGIARPEASIPIIHAAFRPKTVEVQEILRGK
jgi:S-adenosylmethionine decarboxylase